MTTMTAFGGSISHAQSVSVLYDAPPECLLQCCRHGSRLQVSASGAVHTRALSSARDHAINPLVFPLLFPPRFFSFFFLGSSSFLLVYSLLLLLLDDQSPPAPSREMARDRSAADGSPPGSHGAPRPRRPAGPPPALGGDGGHDLGQDLGARPRVRQAVGEVRERGFVATRRCCLRWLRFCARIRGQATDGAHTASHGVLRHCVDQIDGHGGAA